MRPQSALAEIHQQKGEIVEHIDRGEPVVEFDRVEQDGRAVDLDDVAQMQIAVAVAQIASPGPRLEQGRERGEPVAACAGKVDCRLGAAAHLHWRRIPPRCRCSTSTSGRTACSGDSTRSAEAWNASITAARRGIEAKASRPSLAMRSYSIAWSKRCMRSTHSTGSPSPPSRKAPPLSRVMGTTSR